MCKKIYKNIVDETEVDIDDLGGNDVIDLPGDQDDEVDVDFLFGSLGLIVDDLFMDEESSEEGKRERYNHIIKWSVPTLSLTRQ